MISLAEGKENLPIDPIEKAIKDRDIRFDEGDQIIYWLRKSDYEKFLEEVSRREEGLGESWWASFDEVFHLKGEEGVKCGKYSYKRVAGLFEELKISEFEIARALYVGRLPLHTRPRRGSLRIEPPTNLRWWE